MAADPGRHSSCQGEGERAIVLFIHSTLRQHLLRQNLTMLTSPCECESWSFWRTARHSLYGNKLSYNVGQWTGIYSFISTPPRYPASAGQHLLRIGKMASTCDVSHNAATRYSSPGFLQTLFDTWVGKNCTTTPPFFPPWRHGLVPHSTVGETRRADFGGFSCCAYKQRLVERGTPGKVRPRQHPPGYILGAGPI